MKPSEIITDELDPAEIEDICKEVGHRNMGNNLELSEFATGNEEFSRRDDPTYRFGSAPYEQNPFRTDARRIIFSNASRRLGGKTQMCSFAVSDHITTRLTHTQQVAQVSRSIARSLGAK